MYTLAGTPLAVEGAAAHRPTPRRRSISVAADTAPRTKMFSGGTCTKSEMEAVATNHGARSSNHRAASAGLKLEPLSGAAKMAI